MKRSRFGSPDVFSLNPLVALLPVVGKVGRLEPLTSSLYARYERVAMRRRELIEEEHTEEYRCCAVEEAMLKEVLEWLAVKPKAVEEE